MSVFRVPVSLSVAAICCAFQVAAAGDSTSPEQADSVLEEKVTVIANRLADGAGRRDKVPASLTVIEAEAIERSGARTLQELLGLATGTILYDQTGNFVQTTFDQRGFTRGSGTKVFLDGAPINDPLNNGLALHLVPLGQLERVELTRGSSATLAGGGSEAGVIHLQTRRSEEFGGSLSVAAGSYSALQFGGEVGHRVGPWDFDLHGTTGDDDGFRTNAGGRLTRLGGSLGYDLGSERRIALSLVSSSADFGNPGALTPQELAEDREQAPFNLLDYSDQRYSQAALNFRGSLGGPFSLAANLFVADRATESLSTGRIAPLFGGFHSDIEGDSVGTTVQLGHRWQGSRATTDLALGVEWLEARTDTAGTGTPSDDPGNVDPANLLSQNSADRSTRAVYVQESWSPAPDWGVTAGLRYDSDEVSYTEIVPDPANRASLTFSELSARGGVTWAVSGPYVLRISYGESFLPPTVEQLFAFPGFGSNPGLLPEDSATIEVGLHADWSRRADLDVALFLVATENEIIYDPDSALGAFGANVNAGETRRQGIEATLRGQFSSRVRGFVGATLIDAEFANGPDEGNTVPLVPGERFSAGVDADLPRGFFVGGDLLWVGEQVLDNDDANALPRLDAYAVANLRVGWDLPLSTRAAKGGGGVLRLTAQVTNLFDEQYATRGIYAFDYSSGVDSVFLTPAPGRRFLLGAEWRF
jgi:iron complex outermembrane receptor protein